MLAPTVGEQLRVTLDAPTGALRATNPDGTLIKLPPHALDGLLQPGDVLWVKVVSTTPQLSLLRLGQAVPARPDDAAFMDTPGEAFSHTTAMEPDQAAMLRVAWAPPDASRLAAAWRIQVLSIVRQWTGEPAHPMWMARGEAEAAMATARPMPAEQGLIPVHAWAGLSLFLRLYPPGSRTPSPAPRGLASRPWGLRIQGRLPGLGPLDLYVQLSTDGVTLAIQADSADALRRLQGGRLAIARAVTRAGWRLCSCQIVASPSRPGVSDAPASDPEGATLTPAHLAQAASGLPLSLFRVATELVTTLGSLGQ